MHKFYAVKIDETGAILDLDLIERSGGRVWTVYLYDAGEVTHLCELEPSYWLEEIENIPETSPESDDERDRLAEDLLSLFNEDRGIYCHSRQIDRIPLGKNRVFLGWYDSMDDAREHYSGNPKF